MEGNAQTTVRKKQKRRRKREQKPKQLVEGEEEWIQEGEEVGEVHLLEGEGPQLQVVGEVTEGEVEGVLHLLEDEELLRLEDEGQRRPKKECLGFKTVLWSFFQFRFSDLCTFSARALVRFKRLVRRKRSNSCQYSFTFYIALKKLKVGKSLTIKWL